jgi:hypothetical protein
LPLIKLMDRCAKTYGADKLLGEELITSVVDVNFGDFSTLVMTRVAVVLANLTADKIVDGVSKLILKSDIERLKSSANKPKTIALDEILNKGYNLAKQLYVGGSLSLGEFDEIVCKLFTRGILHLCNKEKLGAEKRNSKAQQRYALSSCAMLWYMLAMTS